MKVWPFVLLCSSMIVSEKMNSFPIYLFTSTLADFNFIDTNRFAPKNDKSTSILLLTLAYSNAYEGNYSLTTLWWITVLFAKLVTLITGQQYN